MISHYLKNTNKDELCRRIGTMEQICGAKRMRFHDGPARDMEVIEVRTGGGLTFQILPDRGMGIGRAELFGIPIGWISAVEDVAPWYYNPSGEGWLHSFGGGLLTSCGLTNVGAASTVDGMDVGLHGRISHIPAKDVTISKKWEKETYQFTVSGVVLDYCAMGAKLQLNRTYRMKMGENSISIHDEIQNLGSKPEPWFLLYHFNFGYPLISETTELIISPASDNTGVKDESYRHDASNWAQFSPPSKKECTERVYYHDLTSTKNKNQKNARVQLKNRLSDEFLYMQLEFPINILDHLVEWKMMGEKEYVLGIEPGNCFVSGRNQAEKKQRFNYDPSHLIWQHIDYIKPLYEFKDKLFHVHIKDAKLHRDRLDEVGILATPLEFHTPKLPGLGDVDWGSFFSALTDVGYQGAACIEVEDRAYEGSPEIIKGSLIQSRNYLQQFMIV